MPTCWASLRGLPTGLTDIDNYNHLGYMRTTGPAWMSTLAAPLPPCFRIGGNAAGAAVHGTGVSQPRANRNRKRRVDDPGACPFATWPTGRLFPSGQAHPQQAGSPKADPTGRWRGMTSRDVAARAFASSPASHGPPPCKGMVTDSPCLAGPVRSPMPGSPRAPRQPAPHRPRGFPLFDGRFSVPAGVGLRNQTRVPA